MPTTTHSANPSTPSFAPPAPLPRWSANLHGLDYAAEAERLARPAPPIIDVHAHINGREAAKVYADVQARYGISRTYSMSHYEQAEPVRAVLGDRLRFIAVPDYADPDRVRAHGPGFIDAISRWHTLGARMVKWWVAPRGRDVGRQAGDWRLLTLHNPMRRAHMDHAASLGMMFMCHVADPDNWFATKYKDASLYGTKAEQYEPLEILLDEYRAVPWILAHCAGSPENLDFVEALMDRHPNVNVDLSATKWMVRELSRHTPERFADFLRRRRGRVLFGSDVVTNDGHLGLTGTPGPPASDARSPAEAFELYASRYWALRMMFESQGDRASPIADPDLALVDPAHHDERSSPALRGHRVTPQDLRVLYHDAARELVEPRYEGA